MIIYDDQVLTRHSAIHGAYLTIVGDNSRFGRPRIVNFLLNRRRDWLNNYNAAYNRFKEHPYLNFQLLNYTYVPFEYIPNTPSHILAVYYENIGAIGDEPFTFKSTLVDALTYFNGNYTIPLYVPYKIDSIVPNDTWNEIVLPTVIHLYGKSEMKHSVIMPSINIVFNERM